MSVTTLSTKKPRLSSAFTDFFEPWSEWFQDGLMAKSMTLPKVNISEDKTSYNMDVAAPGLHKKDFKIDVNGNVLTVSAKKEESKEEKNEKYSRQEYNYSSFSRSFTLPDEVEQDKIEASYDGGILKLVLPKNDNAKQKNGKTVSVK